MRIPAVHAFLVIALSASLPATGQIATSNEKGATGAYSSEVDSSFTSEGRFGPKTAIDELRAGVDRNREQVERLRMKQLEEQRPEPAGPPPESEAPEAGDDTDGEPQPE